jgi:hypothetical protein
MGIKLIPRPKCIDCGHIENGQRSHWHWSEAGWLCSVCFNDSWDNDVVKPDYQIQGCDCKGLDDQCEADYETDCKMIAKECIGCPPEMIYCPPLGDCQECIKASEERKEDKPEIQVGDCGSHPECHYGDNCNDCMLNQ